MLELFPELGKMRRPCKILIRPLYGHPRAGYIWECFLDGILVKQLDWIKCPQPQTYMKLKDAQGKVVTEAHLAITNVTSSSTVLAKNGRLHTTMLTCYVDDMIMGGPNQLEEWKAIQNVLDVSEPEVVMRILGVHYHFCKLANGRFQITQEMRKYAEDAVSKYVATHGAIALKKFDTPFVEATAEQLQSEALKQKGLLADVASSLLMTLLFMARMCRGELLYAINMLARDVSRWTRLHDVQLHRIFSYLAANTDIALVSEVCTGDEALDAIVVIGYPDADHAGDPCTARSTSGNLSEVAAMPDNAGVSAWTALTTWTSKRQSCVSHSSTESELVSADRLMREILLPQMDLWSRMLGREVVAILREDNQACIRLLRTGYSAQLRHVAKTHRVNLAFVSECIRNNNVLMEYCDTKVQKADFLTKGLDRMKLQVALELVGLKKSKL